MAPERDAADWRLLHRLHDRVQDPDCPYCAGDYRRANDVAERLRHAAIEGRLR